MSDEIKRCDRCGARCDDERCECDLAVCRSGVERVTAIAGDGVRTRPVSPGCPICTGGRGVPCSWHAT